VGRREPPEQTRKKEKEQNRPPTPQRHVVELSARNTDLSTLAQLLQSQHARKLDVVVPATKLIAEGGLIRLDDVELTADGVTPYGSFRPTDTAVGHLAEKLGIDLRYLRKCHATRPDLFDANVNGWLHGQRSETLTDNGLHHAVIHPADTRSFLFRAFRTDEGGIMRGLLSDKYAIIDNLDVLLAVLDGVQEAGVEIAIDGCDLSEQRMHVRIAVPEVQVMAPVLFENYRSPFGQGRDVRVGNGGGWDIDSARRAAAREGRAYAPGQEPIVFGGFVIDNSELGGGAFGLTPRGIAKICRNGLELPLDAAKTVHLGSRLEEGVVAWSPETRDRQLALIKSKTVDTVKTFVSAEFWQAKVNELEAKAGKPVEDPQKTITAVGKALRYTETQTDAILRHFVLGGQLTSGGIFNAITSVAQTIEDPDVAADMESSAVKALDLA